MKKNTLLFITIFFVILTAVLSGCKKNADLSGGTVSDTTVTTGLYDTDFSDVTVSDTTAPIVFYDADFSDVTVSDKTVPTVFYDGEYGDTSDKSELSFTEIKLNYKKTVTVPDNCYIRINENIGRHTVNKTPLCAVLYDKNGKTCEYNFGFRGDRRGFPGYGRLVETVKDNFGDKFAYDIN